MSGRPAPNRGHYALFALGSALFTVYGSLVPFHFQARPASDAAAAFAWVLSERVAVEARGDAVANVLLCVPLGFFALAALHADRPGRLKAGLATLALLPACALFAASVEFAQLYFPGRTCSATDIVAQSLGSAIGLSGWLVGGAAVTRRLRAAWADPRLGGRPGQRVLAYCAVVVLVQVMPLDIDTSAADLYRRLRDGGADGADTLAPFGELAGAGRPAWALSALALSALFLPAGVLLAAVPSRGGGLGALALGFALAAVTECAQLLVSRHASVSDVLVGAAAVAAGRVVSGPVSGGCRDFRRRCAKDTAVAPCRPTTEAL